MNEEIQTFLVALGSAAGGAGLVGWYLRRVLDRRLEYHFKQREMALEARTRLAEDTAQRMNALALEALPKLQEAVYRARNALRDNWPTEGSAFDLDLTPHIDQIAEILFRARLALPDDVFDAAHQLKGILAQLRDLQEKKGAEGILDSGHDWQMRVDVIYAEITTASKSAVETLRRLP